MIAVVLELAEASAVLAVAVEAETLHALASRFRCSRFDGYDLLISSLPPQ